MLVYRLIGSYQTNNDNPIDSKCTDTGNERISTEFVRYGENAKDSKTTVCFIALHEFIL
jgi:hypothetical protein